MVSCFGLECLDFEESSYNQLSGSLSPDYKYLHAKHFPPKPYLAVSCKNMETETRTHTQTLTSTLAVFCKKATITRESYLRKNIVEISFFKTALHTYILHSFLFHLLKSFKHKHLLYLYMSSEHTVSFHLHRLI